MDSANRTRDAASRTAVSLKSNFRTGCACWNLRSLDVRLELSTAVMQDSRGGYLHGLKVRCVDEEKVR